MNNIQRKAARDKKGDKNNSKKYRKQQNSKFLLVITLSGNRLSSPIKDTGWQKGKEKKI